MRAPSTLTQGEVEEQILDLCDAMERETHAYDEVAHAAAVAEADYKLRLSRALISIANSGPARITAAERQARAEVTAAEELRIWKITEARRAACKESLLSLRARLDALRSLSANIRAQT